MKKFTFCLLAVILAGVIHARVLHVPSVYPTIQQAIEASVPGDTVLVAEGLYYGQVNFLGKKPLLVTSHYLLDADSTHIYNTILDGNHLTDLNDASVVKFVNGEDTTSILQGFTIRNGKGTLVDDGGLLVRYGGGIIITDCGAKISHCIIKDNHLNNTFLGNSDIVTGAGIGTKWQAVEPWVVVEYCTIISNSSTCNSVEASGGGMCICSNARISHNTIKENTCTGQSNCNAVAGGFFVAAETTFGNHITAMVEYNLIANNKSTAQSGVANSGGMLLQTTDGWFTNNQILGNEIVTQGTSGGGAAGLYIYYPREGFLVSDNTFIGNSCILFGGAMVVETIENDPNMYPVMIEDNYFIQNESNFGGALYAANNPLMVQNNVFSQNHSNYIGGAINYYINTVTNLEHKIILVNNSFYGNTASSSGGAIFTQSSAKPLIFNCVFREDSAKYGEEIYLTQHDSLEIANSDIDVSKITGHYVDGGGIINADPLYTDLVLLTTDPGSPVINSGTASFTCDCGDTHVCPQFDILGVPRPWGTTNCDMGAYELAETSGLMAKAPNNFRVFPNPFTDKVTFASDVPLNGSFTLTIFNEHGTSIMELTKELQNPGTTRITWNTSALPPGIYFYRLKAGTVTSSGKLVKGQ